MREHTAFPKWINCGRRRYSYFIRCCAAYTFHHSPTLTPNPLSSSHTLASCTVEVCYRFFLFRPLILFALWTHIRRIWTDPYNPIMRAHKAHKAHFIYTANGAHGSEPAATLFGSTPALCAHKQHTTLANIMRYASRESVLYAAGWLVLLLLVVFPTFLGFNRFRVQPSFVYIWQFPFGSTIYGYTTNIRLCYNKHIATAAFRIKSHCILPIVADNRFATVSTLCVCVYISNSVLYVRNSHFGWSALSLDSSYSICAHPKHIRNIAALVLCALLQRHFMPLSICYISTDPPKYTQYIIRHKIRIENAHYIWTEPRKLTERLFPSIGT